MSPAVSCGFLPRRREWGAEGACSVLQGFEHELEDPGFVAHMLEEMDDMSTGDIIKVTAPRPQLMSCLITQPEVVRAIMW